MKKVLFILFLLLCTTAYAEDAETQDNYFNEITEQKNTDNTQQKQVDLYINGNGITLANFPIIENDTLMLPLSELLSCMDIHDFSVDADNQVTVTYGEKIIALYLDSDTAYLNGTVSKLPEKTVMLCDTVYAPMRTVCEYFGFSVNTDTDSSYLKVYVNDSAHINSASPQEIYVNSAGLSSQTPYLIWINKKDYKVHVFLGSAGNWENIYSCTCAIGKNETPTITGTYKFFSLEKRWNYDDFYVGPIMRFHGGYAIHSTLLKYDGTNYNAAVGKKLSHGCVRVRPDDINWLVSYVPLKTTIHITEE